MEPLRVACAAEGVYDAHSAAMLHSVLVNSPQRPVRVHYLHGPSLPARSARRLASLIRRRGGEIDFHEIGDRRLEGLPVQDLFTAAMWYRILLPELLPDVGRVLYLDVDVLAADDLEPLWRTDLAGHHLAAVTNVFYAQVHADRVAQLGVAQTEYFNSGVLLLDLDRLRADGSAEAIRELAVARAAELDWPDQDALNLVLAGRRLALHPRWNCMNAVVHLPQAREVFGAEAVEQARRRPGLRHFEGPGKNKPWHLLSESEGRELYFHHRRRTPWPLVRRTGVTPPNVLRRARRLVRP